jgi:nucleotide-binding universal stress UspA family protein
MSEVLVGFDGSAQSRVALGWARRIALHRGQALRAIRTWHYPPSAGSPLGATKLATPEEMDRITFEALTAELREELGNDVAAVEAEVVRGIAAGVLVHRAARDEVDLLVLGARGLGGFEGLMLGSVSRQCLEHAPCPTAVLRAPASGTVWPLPERILVGVDGSATGARALAWAAELAVGLDAEVIALHALGGWAPPKIADAARDHLEGAWTEPLRALGARHQMRLDRRDPRAALLVIADQEDAGLVVVGARGLGPMQTVLLGSVAGYVATHATRPLVVVPGPHTAPQ